MRRLLLLLLLCLGLTGMAPLQAAPMAAAGHSHGANGAAPCHDEGRCVHSACLGCALEADLPRLSARPLIAAARPVPFPMLTVRPSRTFALDPPPPRRG